MSSRATPLLCLAFLALGACGGEGPAEAKVFIALDRDFQGYEAWRLYQFDGDSQGRTHPAGPRKVFINQVPAHGAKGFAVGTMIVKEIFEPAPPAHTVTHAMVKRGGGFNAGDGGSLNWEFFELSRSDGGVPAVDWRGIAPPAGRGYPSSIGGTCNSCHGGSAANDFVQSPPLQLSGF